MNNIQEKDWSEEEWGCHTGMADITYWDKKHKKSAEKSNPSIDKPLTSQNRKELP